MWTKNIAAQADFAGASGYAIRRVKLHQLLLDHATEAGVEFHWGARVTQIDESAVATAKENFTYRWLVGADGQNSVVRKWAGLDTRSAIEKRYGFCTHFRLPPWSDVPEVHWAHGCQIFVTPVMAEEVGIAVISRDPGLRLEGALQRFPAIAKKLLGAARTTRESGDTTRLSMLPAVTRGRVALIGDASGTVDAVTGHGLSLSFQQAIALAEAMTAGNLCALSNRPQENRDRTHRHDAPDAADGSLRLDPEQNDSPARKITRLVCADA